MVARIDIAGSRRVLTAQVSDGAAATFTVKSAVAAKIIHLHALLLTTGADAVLTVKFASTVIAVVRLLAKTPFFLNLNPYFIESGSNEVLQITKDNAGTAVDVTAFYTQENAH